MERVEVLIHKLGSQQAAGESAAQLLATTQALYKELLSLQPQPLAPASGKVAVIMPSYSFLPTDNAVVPVAEPTIAASKETFAETEVKEQPTLPAQQPIAKEQEEVEEPESFKSEPYALRKPAVAEVKPKEQAEIPEPSFRKVELPFDAVEEVPTLRHAPQQKELNQLLGSNQESLNDRLKADKTELAQALKTESIKDLRKGIGVNDKFLFINELFRGDETAYERSIKTINAFHILPEAEYWINRELKVKLGWSDTKDTVQHFYAVVRRRFS